MGLVHVVGAWPEVQQEVLSRQIATLHLNFNQTWNQIA